MAWFRRRSAAPSVAGQALDVAGDTPAPSTDLVPLSSMQAIARTERALRMLAAQSAQLHGCVVELEHRLDVLTGTVLDRLERLDQDDAAVARAESQRVGAELARLEVNLAARLDAVRAEITAIAGVPKVEIDLRDLRPTDTGWPQVADVA